MRNFNKWWGGLSEPPRQSFFLAINDQKLMVRPEDDFQWSSSPNEMDQLLLFALAALIGVYRNRISHCVRILMTSLWMIAVCADQDKNTSDAKFSIIQRFQGWPVVFLSHPRTRTKRPRNWSPVRHREPSPTTGRSSSLAISIEPSDMISPAVRRIGLR